MTAEPENLVAAAIEAAEDIRDPLEGLVEKTATDPGAPFAPDALEHLATLKKADRAGFEALRAQLKKAGCRVTALDEAIAEESGFPTPSFFGYMLYATIVLVPIFLLISLLFFWP